MGLYCISRSLLVIAACSLLLNNGVSAACPPLYTQLYAGGTCYRVYLEQMDWASAGLTCRQEAVEAALVMVESDTESDALYNWLEPAAATNFWIGGYQMNGLDPWIWAPTGGNIATFYWMAGEPSNSGGNENCVEFVFIPLASIRRYWNDAVCDDPHPFICEAAEI